MLQTRLNGTSLTFLFFGHFNLSKKRKQTLLDSYPVIAQNMMGKQNCYHGNHQNIFLKNLLL